MTIVPVNQLAPEDLKELGNNTAEAIRQDHEDLEDGNKDLGCLQEQTFDPEAEGED